MRKRRDLDIRLAEVAAAAVMLLFVITAWHALFTTLTTWLFG